LAIQIEHKIAKTYADHRSSILNALGAIKSSSIKKEKQTNT